MKYIAMIVLILASTSANSGIKIGSDPVQGEKIGRDSVVYTVCVYGYLFVVVEKNAYNDGGVSITQVYGNPKGGGSIVTPQPVTCR